MNSRNMVIARALAGFAAAIIFPVAFLVSIASCEGVKPEVYASAAEAKVVTMTVTGYSVDKRQCGKTDGITAAGRDGRKLHGVAAANSLLPLGTRIYIPGVGERVVDDTGGDMRKAARKGKYHIDLRFLGKNDREAYKKATKWGRQTLEVTILEIPPKKEKAVKKKKGKAPATARVVQVDHPF